jgi:hypothetical protein
MRCILGCNYPCGGLFPFSWQISARIQLSDTDRFVHYLEASLPLTRFNGAVVNDVVNEIAHLSCNVALHAMRTRWKHALSEVPGSFSRDFMVQLFFPSTRMLFWRRCADLRICIVARLSVRFFQGSRRRPRLGDLEVRGEISLRFSEMLARLSKDRLHTRLPRQFIAYGVVLTTTYTLSSQLAFSGEARLPLRLVSCYPNDF